MIGGVGLADCWAWGLLLADGKDPGLLDHPASVAHCYEPHAYELQLDERVWSGSYTILCVEHTAKIRGVPHGGIVRIVTTSAGAA